jgi:hypothetical protein
MKMNGIDASDLEKLKTRLTFAWGEEPKMRADTEVTSVTHWRNRSACKAYSNVQSTNDHLFLPFILAASPTDCTTPTFKQVLWFIRYDQKYTSYRLSLGPEGKKTLESIAIECCLVGSNRYLSLMESLFPPQEPKEPRHIEVIYSKASINELLTFLESLTLGVNSSEKAVAEREAGNDTSDCVTVMIPLDTKDCICHFVLNRDAALNAISKYRCTSITGA